MFFSGYFILDITARKAVDKRLAELADEEANPASNGIIEHLLASEKLSMKEIYSNACELLLAGVDTVSIYNTSKTNKHNLKRVKRIATQR